MIEHAIETNLYFDTVTELYNTLPHDIQYSTFKKVLTHLEESNKIAYDKNGVVFWIFVRDKQELDNLQKNTIPFKRLIIK